MQFCEISSSITDVALICNEKNSLGQKTTQKGLSEVRRLTLQVPARKLLRQIQALGGRVPMLSSNHTIAYLYPNVTFHSRKSSQSLSRKTQSLTTPLPRVGSIQFRVTFPTKGFKIFPGAFGAWFLCTPTGEVGGLRPQNQSVTFETPPPG